MVVRMQFQVEGYIGNQSLVQDSKGCALSINMTFPERVNPKRQCRPGWKYRIEAGYYRLKERASPH